MTEQEMLKAFFRGEPDVERLLARLSPATRALALAMARPRKFGKDRSPSQPLVKETEQK